MPRPRRSALYLPALNDRAVAKLASLACDVAILDLEDSVLPERKAEAREAACRALPCLPPRIEAVVRVNPVDSAEGQADLARLAGAPAAALLLPKVERAAEIEAAAAILARAGAPGSLRLWAMIETAQGVLEAPRIAASDPRMEALVLGTADLGRSLRARAVPAAFATARGLVLLAARAAGLDALDAPHFDLDDEAGLQAACDEARGLGFDGKTLIHPRQIAPANRAFAPTAEEIKDARAVLAAHRAARASGSGVSTLRGRLVEALHAEEAERLLALAERIAGRAG